MDGGGGAVGSGRVLGSGWMCGCERRLKFL